MFFSFQCSDINIRYNHTFINDGLFHLVLKSQIDTYNNTYQAGGVELFLACFTLELGQLTGGAVEHGETDHAVLHALKTFIYVTLPQRQTVNDRAVLNK